MRWVRAAPCHHDGSKGMHNLSATCVKEDVCNYFMGACVVCDVVVCELSAREMEKGHRACGWNDVRAHFSTQFSKRCLVKTQSKSTLS